MPVFDRDKLLSALFASTSLEEMELTEILCDFLTNKYQWMTARLA